MEGKAKRGRRMQSKQENDTIDPFVRSMQVSLSQHWHVIVKTRTPRTPIQCETTQHTPNHTAQQHQQLSRRQHVVVLLMRDVVWGVVLSGLA